MQQLHDLTFTGKRVLIRADLNVPLNESQEITDDNRIKQFLPTLQAVLSQGGRAVLMSHLGEPSGVDPKFSLRPVARRLAELLNTDVALAPSTQVRRRTTPNSPRSWRSSEMFLSATRSPQRIVVTPRWLAFQGSSKLRPLVSSCRRRLITISRLSRTPRSLCAW